MDAEGRYGYDNGLENDQQMATNMTSGYDADTCGLPRASLTVLQGKARIQD